MESWMSDLPDDVIHRILSIYALRDPSLSNKNAVRLSLLSKDISKEISNALHECPTLCFHWTDDPRCLQELKYMTLALKHNTHLQTLTFRDAPENRLCSHPASDDHSGFDRCFELATTNSPCLRNLHIRMWPSYVLPQAILRVESLVQLDLWSCVLGPAGSTITWPCLKTLHLVFVEFGDGVFDSMIRGCPFVENLEIYACFFNNITQYFHIKLSNLSYLRQLDTCLTASQTVEVDAAHTLESLAVTGNRQIDMGDKEYHKLERLSLNYLQVLSGDFFTNTEHQYPVLQELCIHGTNIERINISSCSLKTISLFRNPLLEEATFDVPNVRFLEFQSDHVPKLSIAGNSDGWISRITFEVNNANIDTSWFMELEKFMPASNMAETQVTISFEEGFTIFCIHADYRNSSYSACLPGTVIQKLVMERWEYEPEAHLAMEILEGMLLNCRPQRIDVREWHESQLPKLLYRRLVRRARINDPNIQQDVSKIGCWIKLENGLREYQDIDKGEFLKLFKVDHGDRKAEFNFYFKLEYCWRPKNSMITRDDDTHCRYREEIE